MLDAAGAPVDSDGVQVYGFTGRRLDGEMGLWYFRHRKYDANMGRFCSRDPIGAIRQGRMWGRTKRGKEARSTGYVDGMSLYRPYFAPNAMDPTGLLSSKKYHKDIDCGCLQLAINDFGMIIVQGNTSTMVASFKQDDFTGDCCCTPSVHIESANIEQIPEDEEDYDESQNYWIGSGEGYWDIGFFENTWVSTPGTDGFTFYMNTAVLVEGEVVVNCKYDSGQKADQTIELGRGGFSVKWKGNLDLPLGNLLAGLPTPLSGQHVFKFAGDDFEKGKCE